MKTAIKSILTGIGGSLSSKRVALFLFIFAFFGECALAYGGKHGDPTLRDELFYTMSGLIVAVFGEGAIPAIKGMKDRDDKL
jgi:hypothetical protein